jgi:hypothetical protein
MKPILSKSAHIQNFVICSKIQVGIIGPPLQYNNSASRNYDSAFEPTNLLSLITCSARLRLFPRHAMASLHDAPSAAIR